MRDQSDTSLKFAELNQRHGPADEAGETKIRKFNINFGPQHPAAHGVLRLVLELDGEVVERVDPHIGLLHRGTEKLMEARPYTQTTPYFDRLDYVAPMNQEHAYVLAIEKLLGLDVPVRGSLIRVLYLRDRPHPEPPAERHHPGHGRGRADPAAVGLRAAREADGVLRARLRRPAARQLSSARRRAPGPAAEALVQRHRRLVRPASRAICDDIDKLITDNRIFKQRNVDIGVVSRKEAIDRGFSGVMVRGSGIAWDLRRNQPYAALRRLGVRHSAGRERRLLRPLPLPHAGDAASRRRS